MRTRYLLFVFIFILVAAPIYAGTVYYVNGVNGNDSNPGTQLAPWKTIQKAANIMIAGDEVSVAAGNYPERVTITKSGNSGAIISYAATGTVECRGFTVKADYILVKGFKVTANQTGWKAGQGIWVEGKYCTIENNHAYYCPRGGIILTSTSSNCIVRGNRCHRNGMVGVEVHGANNIVENNEVWGSVVYHTPTGLNNGDADGMRFFGSGHIFRGNHIHDIKYDDPENVGYDPHIDGFQTWTDQYHVAGSNILFEKNLIVLPVYKTPRANGHGFILHNCSYITIRNNIVFTHGGTDTDGHQTGGPTHHVKIENNTFIGNLAFNRANSPFGIHLENCSHSSVKNNIIYNQVNQAIRIEGTTSTGLEISNNCIYNENGSIPGGTQYPYDLRGLDPSFRDPAVRDYHLKAGSPCINSGMTRLEIADDFDSAPRPVGGAYDIGAYEFGNQSDTALSITVQPQSLTIQNGQTAILATIPELSVNGIRPLGQARWFGVDSKVSVGNQAIGSSTTYYVDATNGSDANDGLTPEKPWKTISKVNNSIFMPGNSILFKRGETWREQLTVPSSGSAGSPITFGAYGTGDNPLFQYSIAKNSTGNWTQDTGNVWYASSITEDVGHIATTSASTPTILADKKNTKAGCTGQGQFYYDGAADRLYIYSSNNPATDYNGFMELSIGSNTGGKVIGGTQNYITVDGLDIKYAGAHGMQFSNCDHVIIQNCDISYIGGSYLSGTMRYGNGIEIWNGGTNITVQDNTISQCFDEGITSQSAGAVTRSGQVFQRNMVDKCGRGCAISTNSGSPTVTTISVLDNTFTDNGKGWATPGISNGEGKGIQLNCPQITTGICSGNKVIGTASGADPIGQGILVIGGTWTITGNYLEDTNNSAFRVYGGAEGTIAYNIVYDSNRSPGLFHHGTISTSLSVYNNVFVKKDDGDVRCFIYLGVAGGLESTNINFKNNIVVDLGTNTYALVYVETGDTGIALDYNLYYHANVGNLVRWSNGSTYTDAQWATYKSDSGQDAHSPTPANPLFVSATDFHLQSTSPCINTGTDVGLTTDYAGNAVPQGATPDMGAYESGSPTTTTPPEVTTIVPLTIQSTSTTGGGSVTSEGGASATGGGIVTADGGATVTGRGVCWGLTANPEISGSHTHDGSGTGSYVSSLTGLSPNTTYHVRAHATNSSGTGYGSDIAFTTSQEMTLPSVTTSAVTSITSTGATGGGSVTSEGGVTERGLCWGLTANPEISGSHTHDGSGTGSYVSSLTELSPNTTYHVRTYATNSSGTGYGNDVSFMTLTAPGKKLKAPVLKKPGNGAMRQPTVIKLSWSDKNVRPAEVGHRIRIKPNGGSYTYYTVGKNIQSYKPSRLLTNIKYYWNVLAVGDNVGIADSPWSKSGKDNVFTTKK